MHLQESGEMYLETIHILSKKLPNGRAIDVGEYMGYSKPSVSRALSILKEGGYVVSDQDGFLTLTKLGRQTAEKIFGRHKIITEYLLKLGVSYEVASGDACKIEHVISDESLEAFKKNM